MPAVRSRLETTRPRVWIVVACLAAGALPPVAAQAPAPPAAPASAKTWMSNRTAIEDYLRTAEVTDLKAIPVGVTKPSRARLVAGGPVAEMAWKPIRPGRYSGYYESYRNEIAAYELDKHLALDMVPPTVERRVKGDLGAAVMWVSPTQSFKQLGGAPSPPPAHAAAWTRQLSRAKMFDNLIANIDPNLGNWLVDPGWNIVLIDHTRSFTTTRRLVHEMIRVDTDLWARMQALDEAGLQSAVGDWLGKDEIRAMIERRDKMREAIARMVAKSSEAAVFVR
jgi:hypothetical protein